MTVIFCISYTYFVIKTTKVKHTLITLNEVNIGKYINKVSMILQLVLQIICQSLNN